VYEQNLWSLLELDTVRDVHKLHTSIYQIVSRLCHVILALIVMLCFDTVWCFFAFMFISVACGIGCSGRICGHGKPSVPPPYHAKVQQRLTVTEVSHL
jgi:hypothetical protein